LRELFEKHFAVFIFLFLFFVLILCHVFMIHAGRTLETIKWVEEMIDADFVALVALLSKGG
jgi:hypothetical protein